MTSALGGIPKTNKTEAVTDTVALGHTADFCSTVNDLFDSVNSRVLKHPTVPLLSAVSTDTEHVEKWQDNSNFIQSIKFKSSKRSLKFPSMRGWLISLSAFQQMVPDLLQKIPFVLMNRFNQDALENFFSQVNADFYIFLLETI